MSTRPQDRPHFTAKVAQLGALSLAALSADYAECHTPAHCSEGGAFLDRVRRATLAAVDDLTFTDAEALKDLVADGELCDIAAQCAPHAVPEVWAAFGDLHAYDEDVTGVYATRENSLTMLAKWALSQLGDRLILWLVDDLLGATYADTAAADEEADEAAREAMNVCTSWGDRDKYNKDDDDCPVIGCAADGPCDRHDAYTGPLFGLTLASEDEG